jgi:hypothetical protein
VHTVPVNRCGIVEFIRNVHFYGIAFVHHQCRTPEITIIDTARNRLISCSELRESVLDDEVKRCAG